MSEVEPCLKIGDIVEFADRYFGVGYGTIVDSDVVMGSQFWLVRVDYFHIKGVDLRYFSSGNIPVRKFDGGLFSWEK